MQDPALLDALAAIHVPHGAHVQYGAHVQHSTHAPQSADVLMWSDGDEYD